MTVSSMVNVTGVADTTFRTALGLTGLGDPLPNALIGIQADSSGQLAPYLANADTSIVFGPTYTPGQWTKLEAVFNYQSRTVQGFVDGAPMGEVPFTKDASAIIAFLNMALGCSVPLPEVAVYHDEFQTIAAPIPIPSTFSLMGLAILGLIGFGRPLAPKRLPYCSG